MNQIWFGLIWINPKESKTQWPIDTKKNKETKKKQRNQTTPKKTQFSRLV
jgi:hypothetical protein